LSLGLRDIASLGSEVVVRFCNVQDETGKAHLLRRRFVTEFVRRHLLDGSDQVFSWWGRISFTTLETGSLFCCAKPTAAEAKSVKARARFMAMPPEVRLKDMLWGK